ncbi:hypothetical protein FLK61_41310 [Paenalkalicoccus suaedae]|uniref:Uncharacterized protein n=1 Tax=Paenalkalicoccus suaedae TaxID=2592382 RepID=A0A859FJQ9_9BACI|nr:hypothetical protein [Paenalkalicoccus suaedae]QKS73032.1 hypothetical protein FLK61_41310 [Paenalkalicoccus suaedae]
MDEKYSMRTTYLKKYWKFWVLLGVILVAFSVPNILIWDITLIRFISIGYMLLMPLMFGVYVSVREGRG